MSKEPTEMRPAVTRFFETAELRQALLSLLDKRQLINMARCSSLFFDDAINLIWRDVEYPVLLGMDSNSVSRLRSSHSPE